MGYFAVAAHDAHTGFELEAYHLNVCVLPKGWPIPLLGWSIPLFGYKFFFDIGLRITTKTNLRRLRVGLPFDSEDEALTDLSSSVLDTGFSPLILGRPVTV